MSWYQKIFESDIVKACSEKKTENLFCSGKKSLETVPCEIKIFPWNQN